MLNKELVDRILISPIKYEADTLNIISGYTTPTMASWNMKLIQQLQLKPIKIFLIVGICSFDGISINIHEVYKQLVEMRE